MNADFTAMALVRISQLYLSEIYIIRSYIVRSYIVLYLYPTELYLTLYLLYHSEGWEARGE